MALWSGSQLRQRRYAAGVALDAIAHALDMTFVELVSEIEQSEAVSQQVADDYLAAVQQLAPLTETMRRHYAGGEDPGEEQERLAGAPQAR